MPSTNNHIAALLIKQLNGDITAAETTELQTWINLSDENKTIAEEFMNDESLHAGISEMYKVEKNVWARLEGIVGQAPVIRINWWRRIAVAASIILALGIGTYVILSTGGKPATEGHEGRLTDIKPPETNRAMIILADGRKVYLDSADNGELAQQGNIKLVKLSNGQIAYESSPSPQGEGRGEVFNTLSNPRGSKVIDMTLSDGSHVWLNAGSSLRYPVAFVGNERSVEITGEAYFEVSHDASKPFIVSKGEMQVQVLGTHFNVNAYDDEENIKVTLLEGSVQVSASFAKNLAPGVYPDEGRTVKIKPGEQAQITNEIKVVKGVDLNAIMAWQHGLFEFNNAELPVIMRQIARWYDVDVVYEGTLTHTKFGGGISNNLPLSNVLKLLEANGVTFRLEGKKLFVKP